MQSKPSQPLSLRASKSPTAEHGRNELDAATAKRSARSTRLPQLVDINEVATHLGVSVRHVRRLVSERRIPYVKWGNLLRFDPRVLRAWLADKAIAPIAHDRRERKAI